MAFMPVMNVPCSLHSVPHWSLVVVQNSHATYMTIMHANTHDMRLCSSLATGPCYLAAFACAGPYGDPTSKC